jgi:uncharacterized membrane protein
MLEQRYFGRAVQIMATHPFEFFLAGLLSCGLTLLSAGLLVGPAAGGVVAMTLKRCRNQEIVAADIFRGFDNFSSTFVVGLALAGMAIFGSVFLLLPGIILATLFGFALPASVDRSLRPGEALNLARTLAMPDLLGRAVFMTALGVVGLSGAVFMVVGLCVSFPVALAALTLAYHDAAPPPDPAPEAATF